MILALKKPIPFYEMGQNLLKHKNLIVFIQGGPTGNPPIYCDRRISLVALRPNLLIGLPLSWINHVLSVKIAEIAILSSREE